MQKKLTIIFILILMVGYAVVFGIFSYTKIEETNTALKEKLGSNDTTYLYELYLSHPKTDNRQVYGDPNAPVTITAVLDVTSDSSLYFINDILPILKEEFIDAGKVNYYHKNYLVLGDVEKKTDRFKYSAAISCIESEEGYLSFFDDPLPFIEQYGTEECLGSKELIEDAMENEYLRNAISPRFYISIKGRSHIMLDGVPSYERFHRAIREQQIALGE